MKKLFVVLASVMVSVFVSAATSSESPATSPAPAPASAVLSHEGQIKGRVVDTNNESLAGALVEVNGKKIYTDLDGFFTLKLEKESLAEVSMISYKNSQVTLSSEAKNEVKIVLKQ